jgi:hypothetical protein
MASDWIALPLPADWTPAERRAFVGLARALRLRTKAGLEAQAVARRLCQKPDRPGLAAASRVLVDLVVQGWAVRLTDAGAVEVRAPQESDDPAAEKERVRRQELLKRDEQLAVPSVRHFIADMERPREFGGRFVSIFSLMRDGRELRQALEAVRDNADSLRTVIDPYVQVVDSAERCPYTGLRLGDIWRYFRHTWSNQSTSTPGRTLLLLVRDRAAPFHPVIGIAALGSSIVQIKERDDWIGWQSGPLLANLADNPSLAMARWVVRRLEAAMEELYIDDLLEEGLYWPSLWRAPTADALARLRKEAEARRHDHQRFAQRTELKKHVQPADTSAWRQRAESDLFRSKRCLLLAELLRSRSALNDYLYPNPSRAGLVAALNDAEGRRAIAGLVRRAKAESVGTEMADLTVCGAVAPYNALLGGKLVSVLAISPYVLRAYHQRYGGYASVIASSMAGRPVRRPANLVFIGTTSLYGAGSSQYNRIRIPPEVLGGERPIEFRQLGRSRSFGTSHLSGETVAALVRLSEQSRTGIRVNSIFGEGVNPKLRKVRDGLDLLGWPSEVLMQHGRHRIIYGISLVSNLLPYLLRVDQKPKYLFRLGVKDDLAKISDWWLERWLASRIRSSEVLAAVAEHRVERPVRHGARVPVIGCDQAD